MNFTFRKATSTDLKSLKELYLNVAINPRGVARNPSEITDNYINSILELNSTSGLSMVALYQSSIVAEIHAGTKGIAIFDHLLTQLTIGVLPAFQNKGLGGALFRVFLEEVELHRADIFRVELESRAANSAGIKLYKKMGFVEEGRMLHQTRNLDGTHEDGVSMVWFNPSYENKQSL